MADRELMEFAALAAGGYRYIQDFGWIEYLGDGRNGKWWRPLTDDGDALRLVVRLKLGVTIGDLTCSVSWPPHCGWLHEVVEDHQGDVNVATRRAIVRAAAHIGQLMAEEVARG